MKRRPSEVFGISDAELEDICDSVAQDILRRISSSVGPGKKFTVWDERNAGDYDLTFEYCVTAKRVVK